MFTRVRSVLLLVGSLLVVSFMAGAQVAQSSDWGSVPDLTCGPAPCILPPVQVSQTGYPRFSNVIAANPENPAEMLVAADGQTCDSGEDIFSTGDAGTSWSHACFPSLPGTLPSGHPFLAHGLNGVAYAASEAHLLGTGLFQISISHSQDNGKTWSTPVKVERTNGGLYGYRLEVDNSPASPFLNSLYIVGGEYYHNAVNVWHSSDAGATWQRTTVQKVDLSLLIDWPSIALSADGTVYVTWLLCERYPLGCAGKPATIMLASSSDGGTTWTTPLEIAQARLADNPVDYCPKGALPGTSEICISNIPVVTVDNSNGPNSGNVYVAFYHNNGVHIQVGVVTSRDHGQTWSPYVRVSDLDRGDEFYPWVSISADGTVGVTWLDTRKSGSVAYQPYFSVSTDGGATFGGDHQLATGISNPLKNSHLPYIGEFRTSIWVGSALYAVWMDNHSGNLQVAIGGAQF